MAVIEKISSLFIVAFLVASGVEAQSEITFETCETGTGALTSEGNKITAYELLCGDGSESPTLTVTPTGASFTQLCSLLSTGDVTTTDGVTRNFADFLSSPLEKGFTLFAPTDAAFDAIGLDVVDAVLDSDSNVDSTIRNDLLARWLELHILDDSYLVSDFECNANLLTTNPSGTNIAQQVQRTRCSGDAATFNQIGGGNVGDAVQPTVGAPAGVFDQDDFQNNSNPITMILTPNDDNTGFQTSSNLITCNGVIHVVDLPLRPGRPVDYYYYGGKGGKGYGYYNGGKNAKKAKYGYSYYDTGTVAPDSGAVTLKSFFGNRMLQEDETSDQPKAETERNADRENRRARLESLLVDANGNIESMN